LKGIYNMGRNDKLLERIKSKPRISNIASFDSCLKATIVLKITAVNHLVHVLHSFTSLRI
jgi:hypothetical protein